MKKLLFILSVVLFVMGVCLPMFSLEKFLFFGETFSILTGSLYLLKEGEWFLFLVVFGFSVIGPLIKFYLTGMLIWNKEQPQSDKDRLVNKIVKVSKWSMADVFVIAILAATVKLGALASITIHAGLIVFGFAVITSMALTSLLVRGYEMKPVESQAS